MANDPYKVLGISRDADTETVKRAYRELSRKYHPDSYVNNPLSDLAEEKFKEIQEAYTQIMNERSGSHGPGCGWDHDAYTSGQSAYHTDTGGEGRLTEIRIMLNDRQYAEALNRLQAMGNRDADWHFCYAVASFGVGNNADAMSHARLAADMAPGDQEYASFLSHLSNLSRRYQQNPVHTRRSNGGCTRDFCCDLFLADQCCECMGGDLCECC